MAEKDGSKAILLIEDDADLASFVRTGLRDEGYEVGWASNGVQAQGRLEERDWDVIILDLMLPDTTGEVLLSHIRLLNFSPRVLVLTARSRVEDKVQLFQLGCDDYLVKPFAFEELLVRVEALLRRPERVEAQLSDYNGLSLDPTSGTAVRGKLFVKLTPTELNLCRLLLQSPEEVFSRKEMMGSVWGKHSSPVHDTNYLHVHLHNLKKKLEEIGCGGWIKTIRNRGFMMQAEL